MASTSAQRAGLSLVTIVVAAALLVAVLWSARRVVWDPVRVTGFAIAVPALLLLLVARIQLGRFVTFGAEAHGLLTTGIYSRIRNPVYVFGILAIFGIALYGKLWALLVVLPFIIPMQVRRARAEARVLEAAFGDQYRAYRARTWF